MIKPADHLVCISRVYIRYLFGAMESATVQPDLHPNSVLQELTNLP